MRKTAFSILAALHLVSFMTWTAGCSVSAGQIHAEVINATHGSLEQWGKFVEGDDDPETSDCPQWIRQATTEASAINRHQGCRRAGESQHVAVSLWTTWASLTLQQLEGKTFNISLALQTARQLFELWSETADAIEPLPEPPELLLRLVGASNE